MRTIIKVFRAKTWEDLEKAMNRFVGVIDSQVYPMITHTTDMAGHTVIMMISLNDQQIESLGGRGLLPSGVSKGN